MYSLIRVTTIIQYILLVLFVALPPEADPNRGNLRIYFLFLSIATWSINVTIIIRIKLNKDNGPIVFYFNVAYGILLILFLYSMLAFLFPLDF